MMMVAFGSFGISISFPTGPVIFASSPAFKSPEKIHTPLRRVLNRNPRLFSFFVLHKKLEQTPFTSSPLSFV